MFDLFVYSSVLSRCFWCHTSHLLIYTFLSSSILFPSLLLCWFPYSSLLLFTLFTSYFVFFLLPFSPLLFFTFFTSFYSSLSIHVQVMTMRLICGHTEYSCTKCTRKKGHSVLTMLRKPFYLQLSHRISTYLISMLLWYSVRLYSMVWWIVIYPTAARFLSSIQHRCKLLTLVLSFNFCSRSVSISHFLKTLFLTLHLNNATSFPSCPQRGCAHLHRQNTKSSQVRYYIFNYFCLLTALFVICVKHGSYMGYRIILHASKILFVQQKAVM